MSFLLPLAAIGGEAAAGTAEAATAGEAAVAGESAGEAGASRSSNFQQGSQEHGSKSEQKSDTASTIMSSISERAKSGEI